MNIRRIDPAALSDGELEALYRFYCRLHAERSPDEPIPPLEGFVANLQNVPPIVRLTIWALWDPAGKDVLARANLLVPLMEGNEHVVQFEIMVLPEQRRKGIGTEILKLVAGATRDENRRLLITATLSTVPAGEAFLRRIGAEAALEGQSQELRVEEVDRDLMRSWIARAEERAEGFELGFWEGPYPEDRLEEMVIMMEAMNTVPLGSLEVEDFHFTPEQVRAMDEANARAGITRWTYYAREKATGKIAGFTEVFINNHEPSQVEQNLTAVFPAYRNLGLGRWLKAAMIERILDEAPETRVIRTGNADMNEPMLKINREMGFRPAMAQVLWQVGLDKVEEYLKES